MIGSVLGFPAPEDDALRICVRTGVGRGEDYKDCNVLRCSNKLDQETPRGRGERLRRVYMLHFFNYLRSPAFSPPVVNRISRKSSWPCWNVYFLTLTATTRRGKQVERCREGWLPSDRCVRCFVLDVSLVAGVAEPVVEVAGILPVLVGDGGGGSQPCVVRHSKPAHSRDPRNHRRTWSLREVQSPSLPRPRRPHVRKTC
jgi:hypothetical protein